MCALYVTKACGHVAGSCALRAACCIRATFWPIGGGCLETRGTLQRTRNSRPLGVAANSSVLNVGGTVCIHENFPTPSGSSPFFESFDEVAHVLHLPRPLPAL